MHNGFKPKDAKPYINRPIGGHAQQAIGHTIQYAKEGYDGVILIYPFTCMPEITSNAIIHAVSKKYHIPVLTLCFDEQTGQAGVQTRLEAFVDMIKRAAEELKKISCSFTYFVFVDKNFALISFFVTDEDIDQGSFPSTRNTGNNDELTFANFEINIA